MAENRRSCINDLEGAPPVLVPARIPARLIMVNEATFYIVKRFFVIGFTLAL